MDACMHTRTYVPSVKESMEEQSTPNMAQTSPAAISSISCFNRVYVVVVVVLCVTSCKFVCVRVGCTVCGVGIRPSTPQNNQMFMNHPPHKYISTYHLHVPASCRSTSMTKHNQPTYTQIYTHLHHPYMYVPASRPSACGPAAGP